MRNITINKCLARKVSAVIDCGGAAALDPACDLVIEWTCLSSKAREVFIAEEWIWTQIHDFAHVPGLCRGHHLDFARS